MGAAGLAIIQQIAETPPDLLSLIVGSYAPQLRAYARGIDERAVVREPAEAKSYGSQETFFEDVTRSVSLEEPADLEQDVYPLLPALLKKAWERRVSIRMVSLKLSHIYGGIFRTELSLDEQSRKRDNERKLAGVLDTLRGNHSIMRGHDLWLKQRKNQPRADTERRVPVSRPKTVAKRVRDYVPLNLKGYYSFLDSALSIPAIIETAVSRGIKALAITDPNLHGAVEFFTLAKEAGIKPIIGAELRSGGRRLNAYAANAAGYRHLCELLSMDVVSAESLDARRAGLIIVPADSPDVALPEIRYCAPGDRPKLDVIQSIRTLTRLHEAHPEKQRGDFHFLTGAEVAARWSDTAIDATHDLALSSMQTPPQPGSFLKT